MTWQPDLWTYDGLPARATAVAEADEAEETHRKPTQADQILQHLLKGNTITDFEAVELCQCRRLAARIYELKRRGHDIQSRAVETRSGKRVAEYSIATLTRQQQQAA